MVIEDADLIARERAQMHGPFEEALLNKLLNEMDGLREHAQVLFILATRRNNRASEYTSPRGVGRKRAGWPTLSLPP